MLKKRLAFSPQEEGAPYSPWWAKLCQVLWKMIALPGISMLVGAGSSILTAWLLSATGVIVPGSPLDQFLAGWPIFGLIGICLSLCALVIWGLSQWQTTRLLPLAEQNRLYMLKRLGRTYRESLALSLDGISEIKPGFTGRPDEVHSNVDRLLSFPRQPGRALPAGTTIQQLYTEAQGELLLLGKSGAGKSPLLLELAAWLVEQAQQDPTQPLPIILPLSTWSVKRPLLLDWCCEQMAQIYDVSRQICEQWMRQGQIVLLLDDFDGIDKDERPACIAAINAYHHEHLLPLVVCSRCEEYEYAARQRRLTLQDAVIVQPLMYRRVVEYLTQAGKAYDGLRAALERNAALRQLVATPQMLSALMRTYCDVPVRGLSKKEPVLRRQVWAQNIQRMVEQKGNKERYPLKRCALWLHWLASQMRTHNQTVFYPERLQPDWLPAGARRAYTWLAVWVPSALIGGLAGLLTAPLLIPFDFALLCQYSLLSIFLGIIFGTLQASSPLHNARQQLRHQWVQRLALSGLVGGLWSVVFRLNNSSGEIPAGGLARDVALATPVLALGLSCFLLLVLLPRLAARRVRVTSGNQRRNWWTGLRYVHVLHGQYALLVALMLGLATGLSAGIGPGLNYGLSYGLNYGLSYGLNYGLGYGLLCVPLSFILVAPGRGVHLAERLGWTWASLLRSLSASKNLRSPLALISVSLMVFGLSQGLGPGLNQGWGQGLNWGLSWGLSQGLSWGLSWGLSCWFLLGLFQGISRERIDDRDRRAFNRGVHDSLRNGLFMSMASALIIGMASVLSWGLSYELSYGLHYGLSWGLSYELEYELSYGLHAGLSQGLNYAWFFALSGGLLVGVLNGGLGVLRHYILRFLLWQSGLFPWHVQPFLKDATTRVLLLPVDGGYAFSYRELLEYFADDTAMEEIAAIKVRKH